MGILPIPLVYVPDCVALDAVLKEAEIILVASPARARDEMLGTVKVMTWVFGAFCARKDPSPQDGLPDAFDTPPETVNPAATVAAVGSIAAVPPDEVPALPSVPKLTVEEEIDKVHVEGAVSIVADTVTVCP